MRTICSDVYVADYTQQTHSQKGVVIQDKPFDDIQYFELHNNRCFPILAVNFEHNKGFSPQGIQDCECLLRINDVNDGWLLLCELKYCLKKNIDLNADDAYNQLTSTWQLLHDKKLFDKRHTRSYLNISVPDHSDKAPFISFRATQNDQIRWLKRNRIHLLGYNDLLVVNEGQLMVPLVEV